MKSRFGLHLLRHANAKLVPAWRSRPVDDFLSELDTTLSPHPFSFLVNAPELVEISQDVVGGFQEKCQQGNDPGDDEDGPCGKNQ